MPSLGFKVIKRKLDGQCLPCLRFLCLHRKALGCGTMYVSCLLLMFESGSIYISPVEHSTTLSFFIVKISDITGILSCQPEFSAPKNNMSL